MIFKLGYMNNRAHVAKLNKGGVFTAIENEAYQKWKSEWSKSY